MATKIPGKIVLFATGCCNDNNGDLALGAGVSKTYIGRIPDDVLNADRVDVTGSVIFIPAPTNS